MARKRMIDPSIWSSPSFMRLNYRQMIFFVGLFSNADDYGKIKGDPIGLRATIFPSKHISEETIISDLKILEEHNNSDHGMILRYNKNGKSNIWMPKWEVYQKMNYSLTTPRD